MLLMQELMLRLPIKYLVNRNMPKLRRFRRVRVTYIRLNGSLVSMKEFIIEKDFDGQRLDKLMFKLMPTLRASEIYMSLRKKKVRVNGKHKDGTYRLNYGDVVWIYMNDECFSENIVKHSWISAKSDISVVYEDENIIIANKPSGMPSQDIDGNSDSLESRMRSYLYKKGEIDLNSPLSFIPSLCHRIDRNTSGLVIMAKTASALRIINQKIKDREIRKFYICETETAPSPQSGKICGWLFRDQGMRKMIFSTTKPETNPDAVWCETIYKTLKGGSPATVEAELLTGRTHQIRAGFSYIGSPLRGDVKYGAKADGGSQYQRLTSYKIIFDFNTPSGELEYLSGKIITI